MSRVANNPVEVPSGVEVTLGETEISVKGAKGTLAMSVNGQVEIVHNDNVLTFSARSTDKFAKAMSGTTRSLVNNMVTGVSQGFEKKLDLKIPKSLILKKKKSLGRKSYVLTEITCLSS